MPGPRSLITNICACCMRAQRLSNVFPRRSRIVSRQFSQRSPLRDASPNASTSVNSKEDAEPIDQQTLKPSNTTGNVQSSVERGAMSRRLHEATEDALFEGGRAGRKAVEEAGFSEELKQRLLNKVESANFRSDNAAALAEADMGENVGRGSRDIAVGQAWTGVEAPADSVLRMLNDAHKQLDPGLRGPAKIPSPIVDMRMRSSTRQKPGDRIARARDKSSVYASSKDMNLTEEEREEMRRDLKERFGPGVRAMPNSIRGLEALANERIEDAIARGQFKVSFCGMFASMGGLT